jgi:RNA polymerase sigma-70 factor, ECF subfamily
MRSMASAQNAPSRTDGAPDWVFTIRRVAEGDQNALGELYDGTISIVFGLIRRIVGDPQTAEEIALDVYAQIWRQAGSYSQEKGSAITWIIILARSRAIDHVRSRARRSRNMESPIEAASGHSNGDPDPEAAAIAENRRRAIQKALAELAPEQLSVLQMAFFEGLTHIEISEKTGIPLGTIKTRIRSGMVRMRGLLEPQVGGL